MSSPALTTLFNNLVAGAAGCYIARLYTIALLGGGYLRFTDSDFDILAVSTSPAPAPVNGQTYASGGVRIDQKESKTQAHWKIGLDVDTYVLVLMPRPFDAVTGAPFPDTIGSVPFLQACAGGFLDAADFQVDEAYFSSLPTWPLPPGGASPVDCKTIFAGKIGAVDTTNAVAVLTVNDYRDLLSISMPRRFYQAQCHHVLFDADCNADGNMNAASFAATGTVAAGSSQSTIIAQAKPTALGSGTFTLGTLKMTSGLNNGFSRLVTNWDGNVNFSLVQPFPFGLNLGVDTFTVYPGCNKLAATCALFSNSANFDGEPNIPPPETALA
jgi:Uncharacterized conserved protein (DUF2163)/Phage conserved hypothetical protein BR0599